MSAMERYLRDREQAGLLVVPGSLPVAARTAVELCVLWAVHCHFDEAPPHAASVDDDTVARAVHDRDQSQWRFVMLTRRPRMCSLDRRPWRTRVADRAARPLAGILSRQAAHPDGLLGRALGRLWVSETAHVNDTVLELLDAVPGEQVLEIGFGPGRSLGMLAERGVLATGVEVSATMIDLATRRNATLVDDDRITLVKGDGTSLPLPDATFDGVLSVHNVHFWSDPKRTVGEIARVLRPGGRVVLAFRGGEHPLPSRLDPSIYKTVTTGQAVTLLREAGFTVEALVPRPDSPTIAFVKGVAP
jgi:SAM-dependent methyltransferase